MKRILPLFLVATLSAGCFSSKEEVTENAPLELIGDGGDLATSLIDWDDEFEEEEIVPTEDEIAEAEEAEIEANFALFQDRFTVDVPETEYSQINQKIKLFVTQKEDEFKRKALKEKMRVKISGAGYQYGSNYLSMSLRIREIVYKQVPVIKQRETEETELITAVSDPTESEEETPKEELVEKIIVKTQVKTFVYDISKESFIGWDSVFLPDSKIFDIVTPVAKSGLKDLLNDDFNEAWFDKNFGPTAGTYVPWVLDGEGIRLFFDERTLGPLALGVSEVVIPWGKLQGSVHQGFHVMDGMAFQGVEVFVEPAIPAEAAVVPVNPTPAITENVFTGFPMIEVNNHSTGADCWVVVNGNIYDLSSFTHENTEAVDKMKSKCGQDASDIYNTIDLPIGGYNLGPVEG